MGKDVSGGEKSKRMLKEVIAKYNDSADRPIWGRTTKI